MSLDCKEFLISSSWDYLHLLFMMKIKSWLYFERQNKKICNITYSGSNPALGHSTTSWIFTDCDNSLFSIIKSENFRTRRYPHLIYYITLDFHKNFTVCFMNDSSYVSMRESSITTYISKDSKLRVRLFGMTQSQVILSLLRDLPSFLNLTIPNQETTLLPYTPGENPL